MTALRPRRLLLLAVTVAAASAQQPDAARLDARRITSGEFAAQRFGPARWLDGAHFATLEADRDRQAVELIRYEAVSGRRDVLIDVASLRVDGRDRPLVIEDYAFSPDGRSVLVFCDSERVWRQNTRGEYFVVAPGANTPPRRLGGELPKSSLMFAKWSPDGTRVGYVAQNDLWVEDWATGRQTRLTADGSRTIINGTFDWVYEEEFDCRDGFRWSPDGRSIAYWQLDCAGVGEFLMIDNLTDRYARTVPVQYPKAGTTNSACRIGVVSASGGETVWMQTPGDPRNTYLARMEWHPGGDELMLQWLPRHQNVVRIYAAAAATGKVTVVHEESDPAYIDIRDDFRWVAGGRSYFWTSDRGGWRQAFVQPWGKGEAVAWTPPGRDVMGVLLANPDAGQLLLYGSSGDATQQYLYAALDGKPGVQRVTPQDQPGWHDYQVSSDGSLAIHTCSRFDEPPVIDLVRLPAHERVRVLVDNEPLRQRYAAVQKGANEFFQVRIPADGNLGAKEPGSAQPQAATITLDGWVMYPPDFDAQKRWPVLFHVYGEPWSQTVKDTWALGHHLFHRWLTQQGYVVMSLDARGTPAPKGRDWRKALYQKIGVLSSQDWQAAVRTLCAERGWIDRSRLAIWGWSGGGAMTLNLLFRAPDLFAAGMSVAPVTDIALYDTIYQERYCGIPQEVPDVYRDCSPITFAKDLRGALLLVHGTGDDNVHFQHSERLFDELVAHGKKFEYLAYPNRTHSIHEGRNTRAHLYDSLQDFLRRRVVAGPR